MAIKFDKAYNAEIRRVVRNFNQKRNRAIKRGYKYLPPQVTVSELKSRYTSRRQLNRDLNALKRFNREGDKALKVVETSGGAKAIKWEYDYLKRNLQYAKEFYDREIEDAIRLDTPMMVAKSEYINNLKSKRDYLNLELAELNQSQFRTFRNTINEYLYANERNMCGYRNWMNEVELIMRNLGYDNKTINKFFEGFNELSPRQFLNMYRQSALVSRIYELYIPTKDYSFKLSTTEEDAKDLINTFMVEKDEMIKKAKMQDEIKDKGLEEFVKSLTEEKLTIRRQEGRAKLRRKDLTQEQIKQLEDLGWDDLIE
jgi:hypothetical protein